jgi:hypothetical protein
VLAALLALTLLGGAPGLAHDATPAADATFFDTLGLPELEITATDDGFAGIPAETEAGRYLATFANEGTAPAANEEGGSSSVGFVRLPNGRPLADLMPDSAASPTAEGEVDPAVFAWLYETDVAGGAAAEPGATGQAIVDLRPGEYVVHAGPGNLVFKPRRKRRTFQNAGDGPCRLLEIVSPARFERDFAEMAVEPAAMTGELAAAMAARCGLVVVDESVSRLCQEHGLVSPHEFRTNHLGTRLARPGTTNARGEGRCVAGTRGRRRRLG